MKINHGLSSVSVASAAAIALLPIGAARVEAHGFVGDRFFPPTIQTDDPFATDELALPTVSVFKNPAGGGSPAAWETDVGAEFDKEIFPHFALGVSEDWQYLSPQGQKAVYGFDDVE